MASPLEKGRVVKHVWSADGRLIKEITKPSLESDNSLKGVCSAYGDTIEGGRKNLGAFRHAPSENRCLFDLMH